MANLVIKEDLDALVDVLILDANSRLKTGRLSSLLFDRGLFPSNAVGSGAAPADTSVPWIDTSNSVNHILKTFNSATTSWSNARIYDVLFNNVTLTGTSRAVSPVSNDNSTRIATTEWVRLQDFGTGGAWTPNNDGAGSGLDADFFRGNPASFFQQNLSAVRSVELGSGVSGSLSTFIDFHSDATVTDFNARIVRFPSTFNNGSLSIQQTGTGAIELDGGSNLTRNNFTIWHAGNDGAGSGLDADLFRGLPISHFFTGQNASRTSAIPVNDWNTPLFGGFYEAPAAPNGPTTGWQWLLNFRHSNLSSNLGWQFSNPINTNDFYVRGINGGSHFPWAKIWHNRNDGAGSGLDADLFQGNSASFFQRNLKNTTSIELGASVPGNQATFIDFHAQGGAVTFNTRIERGATENGAFVITQGGTGTFRLNGGSNLTRNNFTIWHAGNDGAGSGLDADLFQGLTPGSFLRSSVDTNFNGNRSTARILPFMRSAVNLNNAAGRLAPIEVFAASDSDAFISFHNSQVYAVYFGLRNNELQVGGWSLGNASFRLLRESGPTYNGNLTMAGSITASSDKRQKTNFRKYGDALSKVLNMKVWTHDWKDETRIKDDIGFIAQEYQKIVPQFVLEANDEEKTLSIDYGKNSVMNTRAIQQLHTIIEKLERRVKELEKTQ